MTSNFEKIFYAEREAVASDYRKAAESNRARGCDKAAEKLTKLANMYDPYYIPVEIERD